MISIILHFFSKKKKAKILFHSSYIEKKFVVHFKKHLKDYSKTKKPELIEAISEALKEYNDEKVDFFKLTSLKLISFD